MIYQVADIQLDVCASIRWRLDSSHGFASTQFASQQTSASANAAPQRASATERRDNCWQIHKGRPLKNTLAATHSLGPTLFDSGGSWSAHATNSKTKTEFVLYHFENEQRVPHARMLIDDSERSIELSQKRKIGLTFPFDEIVFINAFSLTNTLLIHSLSILHNGQGYLFCGVSGAGKSTLGKILEDAGFQYLCDERNAIQMRDGQVMLHSTPFYGTSEKALPGQAPLNSIILLNPSHVGATLTRRTADEALTQIYPTLFLPQFSRDKMQNSLSTFENILAHTPIYELNYDRTQVDIVEFLKTHLFDAC